LFFCILLNAKSVIQRYVRSLGHIDVRNVIMNSAVQMMTCESGVLCIKLVYSETLILIRFQLSYLYVLLSHCISEHLCPLAVEFSSLLLPRSRQWNIP